MKAPSQLYHGMSVEVSGRRTSAIEVNRLLKAAGMTRIQVSTTRIRGWNNYSSGDFRCVREKAHGTWGANGPEYFLNIRGTDKSYQRIREILIANGIEIISTGNGFIWAHTL